MSKNGEKMKKMNLWWSTVFMILCFMGFLVITSLHIYFGSCPVQGTRKHNISQITTIILVCKMSTNGEEYKTKGIYGGLLYLWYCVLWVIGYNISSYIFWKLSGAKDAQRQHFTDHHNHFSVQNVKKLWKNEKNEFMMF